MPAPAPTLRSLARTLGLSRTTVSDALRGSPRVDPVTALRVKKAAREAGYRRNPLAGALMSELRRSRGTSFRGVLAAVDFNEPDRPDFAARFHSELVAGAQTRATELGFKLEKFCHRAFYNREKQRVEMHLVSLARQKVRVMGKLIDFRRGETIHTENSYKYTVELFRSHARSAGWTPAAFWLDEQKYFSVHALVAAAPVEAVRSGGGAGP